MPIKSPLFMERYSTTVTTATLEKDPDAGVKIAYGNFVREPLRAFARDEVQCRSGLDVKEALMPIGVAVLSRNGRTKNGGPKGPRYVPDVRMSRGPLGPPNVPDVRIFARTFRSA